MPVEMALWRADGEPVRLTSSGIPREDRLEELIERDPGILGEQLMIIGRQVITDNNGRIDLLAVDRDGSVHMLELKRNKTPREVVAQALDYGLWVRDQGAKIVEVFAKYRPAADFGAEFEKVFLSEPPEEINRNHFLTIVAADVDAATERIIEYLTSGYGVPLNVVFFRYFDDDGRTYLARTWLRDREQVAESTAKAIKTKEPWNGVDWYVSFGDSGGQRVWADGRMYGFVSAGGGEWFSRTLRNVPVDARVFAYIPQTGYVGVGRVIGAATPFADALVQIDGEPERLADQPLEGTYLHGNGEEEWVLPVSWESTRARDQAFKQPGLFGNQNSAAKFRHRATLDALYQEFGLTADGA